MGKAARTWMTAALMGTMATMMVPAVSFAATTSDQSVAQGVGSGVLDNANYFGDTDPSTPVTIDIVLKAQNENALAQYIKQTTSPGSGFRKYLSTSEFAQQFAPDPRFIQAVTQYLGAFGIQPKVYDNHLVITATGTAGEFNKAFNVTLQDAQYKGKHFHGTRTAPKVPKIIADNILCVLGLSDYSNLASQAKKAITPQGTVQAAGAPSPSALMPQDLEKRYNVDPLVQKGTTGQGQTIGIVTLADFNPSDAEHFWNVAQIQTKPDRIHVTKVDGGSQLSEAAGSDETTLDVEQSGALAPDANIDVYVAPNSDTGFVDAFAQAISDNVAQQISVSWGESEDVIQYFVDQQMETPQYAEAFNQLFMEGAAQGISMFGATGDSGAYSATRDLGTYELSVQSPTDSPYMTAAGGTTIPALDAAAFGVTKERAWGWDYLYGFLQSLGYPMPNADSFAGGAGGFSKDFATPYYQQGVSGVNQYTGVKWWTPSADNTSVTFNATPQVVHGTGTGRNLPDLSMNADPESGYSIYFSLPTGNGDGTVDTGWYQYGGTSFVAPQLAGLSALINSADHTRVGFWNPQIYQFAQAPNSPFHPLNTTGTSNDNLFYTGTPGTIYNQATGLGTPDIALLAKDFANE